jgi:hypothetical protein
MAVTQFHVHADLDDPSKLPAAVAAATGERDVKLLAGWLGRDRDTGALLPDEASAAVSIEWLRSRGRFALNILVYCRGVAETETKGGFARGLARALGRAVLFSDCSAFGYSYFSAEPDGAILAQLLVVDEADPDRMDLDAYDHPDPRHRYPRLVFSADEALPPWTRDAPETWARGDTTCELMIGGRPCRIFNLPCPKHRLAAPP